MAWFKGTGRDEILVGEEPIYYGQHVGYDEPVIKRSSEEDMVWAPVASLIKTLPYLPTLVYKCRNQFPPVLLDALHEHRPQCKLQHLTFRLRSLLSDTPDPYEMASAMSPCLYGVKVGCAWRDSNGDDDFNQEAMMELVAGLAPNLKDVQVVNLVADRSWRFPHPRGPWQGLPGFVPSSGLGSLTSLSLVGWVDWSPDLLQAWARHTDLGSLHHLALGGGYGHLSGMNDEIMEWIVQNCSFPRLKTLRVVLNRDNTDAENPHYTDNAIAFFRAFEPLDELSMAGSLEPKILDAILSRYGLTLQKLSLTPEERPSGLLGREMPMIFGKEHILQIQVQCPALQELAMPVKRMNSNALEVEIYRIFGRMERLQFLFLTLDCSNGRVTQDSTLIDDPSFDGYDRGFSEILDFLKRGYLREAYKNCAVDEMLARSIWDTTCQGKVGKSLEFLKLWTRGGYQFGNNTSNGGISDVVDNLSRSWLIERDVRDDKNMISIREMDRRVREIRDREVEDVAKSRAPGRHIEDSDFMRVFRRIWPRKEGSKGWREDGASLPLQV